MGDIIDFFQNLKIPKKYFKVAGVAAALLVVLLVMRGCGSREYWPLDEGNVWEFATRLQGGPVSGTVIYQVKSVTKNGKNKTARIEVKTSSAKTPMYEMELVSTPAGIYESGRTEYPGDGQSAEPRRLKFSADGGDVPYIFMAKPGIGNRWDFSYTRTGENEPATVFKGMGMVEDEQGMSLDVGEFNAFKIRWQTEGGTGGKEKDIRFYWFKKGIGPVKIGETNSGAEVTYMLKRAKIGRRKFGKW